MAKITGIGGLEGFGGAILRWPDDKADDGGLTVWHVAEKDTQWFSPSPSSFMINYRVDNLGELLAQLRADGVEIVGGPESHENGTFAWIMDPDGNKVELWEPKRWDDKNKGARDARTPARTDRPDGEAGSRPPSDGRRELLRRIRTRAPEKSAPAARSGRAAGGRRRRGA